jgi:hypothetical protein
VNANGRLSATPSRPQAEFFQFYRTSRDHLEQLSSRLALTERLAALVADTPDELLPSVCYRCQG